jgi:3-methylcrotonyl-CoA carboxylase alpha subunit
VPGYDGATQDDATLGEEALRIGYPLMIKAIAGGGGRGMRRVDGAAGFPAALAACRREALQAFGDDRVLVEQYVLRPRHVEVQVFADRHGHFIHLFERDCSVQRRHQKILEEAPAPGMTPERRAAMGAAAVEAARAVGYVGAGTVEFIVDPSGAFYFMEMNTRLQVEHPVTEMITGIDIVEHQLRIAAGEPLALAQDHVHFHGHAIEARINAEDPDKGYQPNPGPIERFDVPLDRGPGIVRVDTHLAPPDRVPPFYDSLVAKVIAHGETREAARETLKRALAGTDARGVPTTIPAHLKILDDPRFVSGAYDTSLLATAAAE